MSPIGPHPDLLSDEGARSHCPEASRGAADFGRTRRRTTSSGHPTTRCTRGREKNLGRDLLGSGIDKLCPERGHRDSFYQQIGLILSTAARGLYDAGARVLDSKVALVTGSAQGLGAATAVKLAARGWSVVVVDIDEAGAKQTVASCNQSAHAGSASCESLAVAVDLATPDGSQRMIAETVRRFDRLDVLINCAAYAPVESFFEMTAKGWELALQINVRAVALSMSAAGRVMVQQRSGHIVNVTSAATRMALPNFAAYSATKAAVDALTRAGAVVLGPHNVRVNSFSPGMMDTAMQRSIEDQFARLEGRADLEAFKAERTARVPLKRRTNSEEMADSLVWLAIDSPPYMTAERMNVTGGLEVQ